MIFDDLLFMFPNDPGLIGDFRREELPRKTTGQVVTPFEKPSKILITSYHMSQLIKQFSLQESQLAADSWQHLGSPLSGSALSTMSSKTEKADVAKAGEDLQAYLEFLGEFSAQA